MPFEKSLPADSSGPLEPVCRHMRSKGMFVAGQMEPEPDMQQAGSGHCWCNQTQNVLGPDAQLVERQMCNTQRVCYVGML